MYGVEVICGYTGSPSLYQKRSNVESMFSAIKRKFGDSVRSRTPTA